MKILNTAYTVNKEERKITCHLTVFTWDKEGDKKEQTFQATATCLPEDKWNVEFGKEIALTKAKKKVMKNDMFCIDKNLKKLYRMRYKMERLLAERQKEHYHASCYFFDLERELIKKCK